MRNSALVGGSIMTDKKKPPQPGSIEDVVACLAEMGLSLDDAGKPGSIEDVVACLAEMGLSLDDAGKTVEATNRHNEELAKKMKVEIKK